MPDSFAELAEPHRRELLLHCYRMLGSMTDAEDALQETMLAAWRGFDGYEGRASPRTWLYRIATNRCLNFARSLSRQTPVAPFTPPEPNGHHDVPWLEPCPAGVYETRENIELAFIMALQRMPPRQAATLILRDVLDFSPDEVATMLDTTPTAVKGTLQRARAAVAAAGPTHSPAPGSDVTRRFADAFTAADVDAVVALLTDDAWLAMPPAPHEYHGIPAIGAFLRAARSSRPVTLAPVCANGQPAFDVHLGGAPAGVLVLTLTGDRIAALTRFLEAGPLRTA